MKTPNYMEVAARHVERRRPDGRPAFLAASGGSGPEGPRTDRGPVRCAPNQPRAALPVALFALIVAAAAAPALAVDVTNTRLLSQPAVSADHVAFAYAGDLWIAGRDGAGARRLTSHEGTESRPRFSPDGSLVTFSAEYDGNVDVFVIPAAGGEPKRLTWHPGADVVQGFTVDGSAVLFASQRSMFTNRHFQLFTVPLGGGLPAKLPIPHGLRASYSPDGRRIAYIPTSERFQQWKNYRGGTTSRIWIYDTGDHSVQTIPQPEGRSNDTNPTWIGNRVFFRSDRDGEFNLYSFDTGSGEIVRHSEFEDFHVEDLSGSADAIVYEQAGYLHLYDPASDRHERLRIGIAADLTETRPRWIEGPEYIRSASISPSGARAVFGYRGEVLTLPAKKGDARNLTRTPGVHERDPVWSPDGGSIAWFSDEGGEYGLHVRDQDSGDVRRYELGGERGGNGFYHAPEWSPDGKRISYVDNSMTLFVLDLESGDVAKVASEHYYGPSFPPRPGHSWAPDSRYVAYTLNTRSYMQQVFVYDVEARTSHPVTDGLSEVGEPVFDRSGDYLFFRASTDAGPVKHWFAMSNADMEVSSAIYVAVLRQDGESPLAAESDEETVASAGEDEDAADGAGGAADGDRNGSEADGGAGDDGDEDGNGDEDGPSVEIDFEGLNQRILALPVQAGGYSNLEAGEAGKLYYVRSSPAGRFGGGGGDLVMFDLTEREETVLLSGVVGFSLSADGKKILYAGRDDFGIADAGGRIDRAKSAMPTDKLTVRIDPRAEWKQIYDEVWRINRDYFYDPGMHGADWPAMAEKYSGFLTDVATRDDLNRVLRWMCSEIAVGHHRVGGGDRRADPERVGGGLLGADFEIADSRYRFAHVLGGLNWNPELRAPLTEPGVSVTAGEYLLAVDGVDLEASDNVFSRFENTAGKITDITVGPNADGSGSRTVSVVPIGNESALRNREWVEGNLAKVDEATGGRVAYVYVPNTTTLGHTYFKRYFFPQVHKQALIVDERFNGGGQVADYYIDHLRRPYISHWATRYGADFRTPSAAILGPKVMIIDETAGSGGDLLPWMFRKLGLGTLVGKRTWGGLVGTLGFPVLMDGGFVTAPNLAIWTEDGFVVENVGVPPDVDVEQWPADIIAGRDPQLDKAIEIVLEQLEANPPAEPVKPPFPIRVRR